MSSLQLQQGLQSIIKGRLLTPYFQPIISLVEKKIIGYEALIRGPSDSCLHNPINLFRVAEEFNLTTQLDFMCREISIEHYAHFNLNTKLLFLNVSPHILKSPKFKPGETLRYLAQFSLSPHDVVIELTEHKPIDDYGLMREAVAHYRSMGFEIALDDLGVGYSSSLRMWLELLPEYIKIDRHFIRELQNDTLKFNLVRAVQAVANSLHCSVIAEGIETDAEFKAIEELGVTHAQGYFFARPTSVPRVRINTAFFSINDPADEKTAWLNAVPVEIISEFIEPISTEMSIANVLNLFQHHHELTFLPLVDNGVATGIIFRDIFLSKLFSSRYGMDLHGRKAIKTFVNQPPFSVDHKTPVEVVSRQLTSGVHSEQAFIVTREGEYIGVATVLSLLAAITQQQIDNAKHANPLTLLPGSVPMNEQINLLITNKIPFSFGYFDLDNFKPFNDIYGYSVGDDIIKAVATTLTACVPIESGYVGHIGGDDFIVIFTGHDWLECCQQILATFEKHAMTYYTPEDIAAGGIWAENRIGEKCFFPMTSLSVGLVSPETTRHCQSHVDVADLAAEAKKSAKKINGSSYFVNQRQRPQTVEKSELV